MINDNMTKDVIGPADFSQNLPPLVEFVLLIAYVMEIHPPLPSNSMPRISDTIFTRTCISYEEWQNDSQHKTELSSHSLMNIFYKTQYIHNFIQFNLSSRSYYISMYLIILYESKSSGLCPGEDEKHCSTMFVYPTTTTRVFSYLFSRIKHHYIN